MSYAKIPKTAGEGREKKHEAGTRYRYKEVKAVHATMQSHRTGLKVMRSTPRQGPLGFSDEYQSKRRIRYPVDDYEHIFGLQTRITSKRVLGHFHEAKVEIFSLQYTSVSFPRSLIPVDDDSRKLQILDHPGFSLDRANRINRRRPALEKC